MSKEGSRSETAASCEYRFVHGNAPSAAVNSPRICWISQSAFHCAAVRPPSRNTGWKNRDTSHRHDQSVSSAGLLELPNDAVALRRRSIDGYKVVVVQIHTPSVDFPQKIYNFIRGERLTHKISKRIAAAISYRPKSKREFVFGSWLVRVTLGFHAVYLPREATGGRDRWSAGCGTGIQGRQAAVIDSSPQTSRRSAAQNCCSRLAGPSGVTAAPWKGARI